MPRILLAILVAALVVSIRAGTLALWLFDEPDGAGPGSLLAGAGPSGCALLLGPGARLVAGKYGRALHPTIDGAATRPAAIFSRRATDRGGVPALNPTDSRLNLGAHDWTIECWLRLDRAAATEGVIFEIGHGSRSEDEVVTRFSILPAENAFAFAGISTAAAAGSDVITRRIEYPNPEGPPGGVAYICTTTLALNDQSLPRNAWFHVALVNSAAAGELRLFLDGKPRAVVFLRIDRLPHDDEAYISIGADGRGRRPVAGAIDELRLSDEAVYVHEFAPPPSFSPRV